MLLWYPCGQSNRTKAAEYSWAFLDSDWLLRKMDLRIWNHLNSILSLSSLRFQTGDTNSSSFELAITSLWHPVANNSNSTKTWHESAFQMRWQAGWHALGNPVWSLRDLTPKTTVETQNFKNLQDKDRKWYETHGKTQSVVMKPERISVKLFGWVCTVKRCGKVWQVPTWSNLKRHVFTCLIVFTVSHKHRRALRHGSVAPA